MIITIKNFGPIKEFAFDTDTDFMLMVGENNVGKSYAVSLVYLILRSFLVKDNDYYHSENLTNTIRHLAKNYEFSKKSDGEADISGFLNSCVSVLLDDWFVADLNKSIENSFDGFFNINNRFSREKAEIKLLSKSSYPNTRNDFTEFCLSNAGDKFVISKPVFREVILRRSEDKKENIVCHEKSLFFYMGDKPDLQLLVLGAFMSPMFFNFYMDIKGYLNGVYYFPASRSGLLTGLSGFGPIFAALSQERSVIRKSFDIPSIPQPLSDYFLEVSKIKVRKDSSYSIYVQEIEDKILFGSVKFDETKKTLLFSPVNTDLSLELSLTSSMVSEISPIAAYLKYILPEPKDIGSIDSPLIQKSLIILEEPEAHIHPANQVKLIKILAKLVKDGKIKLIITSHSNYLFNQCSNLVMDGSIDKDSFSAVLLKATENGSEAVDLEVDEYGIEDNNFVDVAEAVFEEKVALFEKINGTV